MSEKTEPSSDVDAANSSVVYDQRYATGYRQTLNSFELARASAVTHVLTKVLGLKGKRRALDYGSGSGLFTAVLRDALPEADLYACDISGVAIQQLKECQPRVSAEPMVDSRQPFGQGLFDLVLSIEVLEHVDDLELYLQDIYDSLAPGGWFVWTTPCANAWSIEWLYSQLTRKVIRMEDGINWNWDEEGHVRRVKTGYIAKRLRKIGFDKVGFRMRSHFFSWTCVQLGKLIPKYRVHRMLEKIMFLDYTLFRRLPNGASMVGFARKPL